MNSDLYCISYDQNQGDNPIYYFTDDNNYRKIIDYNQENYSSRITLIGKIKMITFNEYKEDITERTMKLLSNLQQYEKEKERYNKDKQKLEKDKQRLQEEIEKFQSKKMKFIKKRDSQSDSESSEDEKPKKKK